MTATKPNAMERAILLPCCKLLEAEIGGIVEVVVGEADLEAEALFEKDLVADKVAVLIALVLLIIVVSVVGACGAVVDGCTGSKAEISEAMIVDTGTIGAASTEGLITTGSADAAEGRMGATTATEGLIGGTTADASGTTFDTWGTTAGALGTTIGAAADGTAAAETDGFWFTTGSPEITTAFS